MRDKYLGDSYDLVKRFWAESLRAVGPLYAHPRFVPTAIRTRYTAVTRVPILDPARPPNPPFGVLLDPHTGIPLPTASGSEATASHAPLPFIVRVNAALRPTYLVCFDQGYHRRHELTRLEQMERKREALRGSGIGSFYYDSHAPFLFLAEQPVALASVREQLVTLGIPPERLIPRDAAQSPAPDSSREAVDGSPCAPVVLTSAGSRRRDGR